MNHVIIAPWGEKEFEGIISDQLNVVITLSGDESWKLVIKELIDEGVSESRIKKGVEIPEGSMVAKDEWLEVNEYKISTFEELASELRKITGTVEGGDDFVKIRQVEDDEVISLIKENGPLKVAEYLLDSGQSLLLSLYWSRLFPKDGVYTLDIAAAVGLLEFKMYQQLKEG